MKRLAAALCCLLLAGCTPMTPEQKQQLWNNTGAALRMMGRTYQTQPPAGYYQQHYENYQQREQLRRIEDQNSHIEQMLQQERLGRLQRTGRYY